MSCQTQSRNSQFARSDPRRAFSLVEVLAAMALMAATLAPTLAAMRSAMAQSREASMRRMLANYAVRTLESHAAMVMQNWANASVGSSYGYEGHPTVRYRIVKSDSLASGGDPGKLMNIDVTVWEDVDGDSTADATELQVVMRTKVSKLLTYQHVH